MQEFFCSRLRLSSSLQFGIGWDEQNGLSQGIYTQLALISHVQRAQSMLLAYVIKLEKHNLTDQKAHSAPKKKKKSTVYMLLVTWLGRNLCFNKASSFVCHVSLAGYASHIMQL